MLVMTVVSMPGKRSISGASSKPLITRSIDTPNADRDGWDVQFSRCK